LAACTTGDPPAEPIVIGNVGTTSGSTGQRSDGMQQAVQASAEVVNRDGGIAGRAVRVEVADDAEDPAEHLRLTEEMVERKGVVAFAGSPAHATQQASVEYLEDKGVPVAGGVIGSPVWGTSPILFPQGVAGSDKADMLMRVAATSGKTRYGYLGVNADARAQTVTALEGGAAARAGLEVVFDAGIEVDAADYTDVCLAAQRAGVEILTIGAFPATLAKITESCARQQFHPTYVTSGSSTTQEILDLTGDEMEGAIGPARTPPWTADQPADLHVWREAMAADGIEANFASLLGWTSARLLEAALHRVDGEITPAAVAEALRSLDGDDLGGLVAPLGFGSSPAEPNPGATCFWSVVAQNGAWVPAKEGRICLN
jgi:branched-chain amino acid transport system substrate-binding protein